MIDQSIDREREGGGGGGEGGRGGREGGRERDEQRSYKIILTLSEVLMSAPRSRRFFNRSVYFITAA